MKQPAGGRWSAADVPAQQGRTAVITGGSGGLGLVTAGVLAARGASVVIGGRDPAKLAAAASQLAAAQPGADVATLQVDLASLESVRTAAAELAGRCPRIDLLINNAGVMMAPYGLTRDGYELQFGTNHLGHFAFTGLVISRLLATPGSRVVTLSSISHRTGRINFDDLNSARHYRRSAAYGQSKLANLMFSYELQRRLAAAGVPVIALAAHPGIARTELTRHSPLLARLQDERLRAVNSWFVQDAAAGALPVLRAAADPAAVGGTYYGPDGFAQFTGSPVVVTSSGRSNNKPAQRRLWVESEQLTGIKYPV